MTHSLSFTDHFRNFPANWSGHETASANDGTLSFAPQRYDSPVLVTKRSDFADFRMTVKTRIVSGAVGLVLRYQDPDDYYMVQFDIAPGEDGDKAWFHAFSNQYEALYQDRITSRSQLKAVIESDKDGLVALAGRGERKFRYHPPQKIIEKLKLSIAPRTQSYPAVPSI